MPQMSNSQMVKNIHRCAKYYLRGTQTEEIPHIPYFLQESLWLKSRFGMEQTRANKNHYYAWHCKQP